jgi:hypothetical protein
VCLILTILKMGKTMPLIQIIYYMAKTTFIEMHLANVIIGAYNTNVVTMFRFPNVIGTLAESAPNTGTINPLCNDPLVALIKDAISTIIGILTALGVAIAVIGIIVGGLMRATAWGSEQRIGMSNKAISSAVVGLVIVLLGVAVGSAIPGWLHMQGSSCPLTPPSSSPAPGPTSSSAPVSHSTSSIEHKPIPGSSQQASRALLAASALMPATASVVASPQTTLNYAFQEYNQYTNLMSGGMVRIGHGWFLR